jgi:penicillin G amidase
LVPNFVRWIVLGLLALVLLSAAGFIWALSRQGVPDTYWQNYSLAEVTFDSNGIPTITADTWQDLVKTQGLIHGGDRLWQMDLLRRSAKGQLSEWFGERATALDDRRKQQGTSAVLKKAAQLLPVEQRQHCEWYAQGVNQFIQEFPGRWGIEYQILRTSPESWTCEDSLASLFLMTETLTTSYRKDFARWQWQSILPEGWFRFLFPTSHLWNDPLFKPMLETSIDSRILPELPMLNASDIPVKSMYETVAQLGSNSWVVQTDDNYILANDPHLFPRVPQVWYAAHLRINADEWVSGVSLPGIPGIVLGMNQDLAWAFTNVGEDVDDLFLEQIDIKQRSYLKQLPDGSRQWLPLIVRPEWDEAPETDRWRYFATDKGPLVEVIDGENGLFLSRKWVGFDPSSLRLPIVELNRAKDWGEANRALDGMLAPAQNVIVAEKKGAFGYRASGRGVERTWKGAILNTTPGLGETIWKGTDDRPRLKHERIVPEANTGINPRGLFIANQRIWADGWIHEWASDDRAERIASYFVNEKTADVAASARLQLDTHSRFALRILAWFSAYLKDHEAKHWQSILRHWQSWDGYIQTNPEVYRDALYLEERLTNLILSRLELAYRQTAELPLYRYGLRRAWLLQLLEQPEIWQKLGLDAKDVAQTIMAELMKRPIGVAYALKNRWAAQHPFVATVPLFGSLFAVEQIPQMGSPHVVRVESAEAIASVRMIWDLNHPEKSLWSFPVGQSGHVWKAQFRDFQKIWRRDEYVPVFR